MKLYTPYGFKTPLKAIKFENIPCVKLVFSNGSFLECSEDHLLFKHDYSTIYAKDSLDQFVIHQFDEDVKVISIESIGNHTCYDVSIEEEQYYTNGILSHNSTISAVFLLHYVLFNSSKTVALLANKASTAKEILSRLKLAYQNLPRFLQQGILEWNKNSIELENGSKVLASASSSSNIRGMSISCVSIDSYITVLDKRDDKLKYDSIKNLIHTHYTNSIPNGFYPNEHLQVLTSEGFKDFDGFSVSYKEVMKLTFIPLVKERDNFLICTPDHLLFDSKSGRFRRSDSFELEETIGTLLTSRHAFITEIEVKGNRRTVVDLVNVQDVSSFIANDVNVHNCLFIDECLSSDTLVTVRDKETGEEKDIHLEELYSEASSND